MLAKDKIDKACSDLIKTCRQHSSLFSLSSWSIDYTLNPISALGAAQIGESVGRHFDMPEIGSFVGAAASGLSFTKGAGWKNALSESPFSYAAQIERELF